MNLKGTGRKLEELSYHGYMIYVAYKDYILLIDKGSGDNLEDEDIENGFVDYFNLEVYRKDDLQILRDGGVPNTIGGGFMLRTKEISKELYGKTVKEVVDEVFRSNEAFGFEDYHDLYVKGIPEYEVIGVEEIAA